MDINLAEKQIPIILKVNFQSHGLSSQSFNVDSFGFGRSWPERTVYKIGYKLLINACNEVQ